MKNIRFYIVELQRQFMISYEENTEGIMGMKTGIVHVMQVHRLICINFSFENFYFFRPFIVNRT
jgi:hypothetical protein